MEVVIQEQLGPGAWIADSGGPITLESDFCKTKSDFSA